MKFNKTTWIFIILFIISFIILPRLFQGSLIVLIINTTFFILIIIGIIYDLFEERKAKKNKQN